MTEGLSIGAVFVDEHVSPVFSMPGLLMVGASVLIDRIFYGVWTFVPYNFVKFNVLVHTPQHP